MKVGAIKYRPEGRNWPAGREFETPGLDTSYSLLKNKIPYSYFSKRVRNNLKTGSQPTYNIPKW